MRRREKAVLGCIGDPPMYPIRINRTWSGWQEQKLTSSFARAMIHVRAIGKYQGFFFQNSHTQNVHYIQSLIVFASWGA